MAADDVPIRYDGPNADLVNEVIEVAFEAHDELIDTTFVWHGHHPWIRLDPGLQPAHLLHLRQP